MHNLVLRPVEPRRHNLIGYANLLARTFSQGGRTMTVDYLDWLYLQNPDGMIFGMDAWDGDRLGAHYVCTPVKLKLRNEVLPCLLSLNTATDPDYQGQGLFTELARATFDAARQAGFCAVIGVANANSTPGFLRKLEFKLVSPLQALIGVGPLRLLADRIDTAVTELIRHWTLEALAWRMRNPNRPIHVAKMTPGATAFAGPSNMRGVTAWTERPIDDRWNLVAAPIPSDFGIRIFLGLIPESASRTKLYVDIPLQIRPAPLNFIYRPLREDAPENLSSERIFFDFLDFDAF